MSRAEQPIVELAALVPGERFTRIGAPNVVYVKTSHTWASLSWKGRVTSTPMHWTTPVRRATPDQLNPGEEALQ